VINEMLSIVSEICETTLIQCFVWV